LDDEVAELHQMDDLQQEFDQFVWQAVIDTDRLLGPVDRVGCPLRSDCLDQGLQKTKQFIRYPAIRDGLSHRPRGRPEATDCLEQLAHAVGLRPGLGDTPLILAGIDPKVIHGMHDPRISFLQRGRS
jgi:hypothetical protein